MYSIGVSYWDTAWVIKTSVSEGVILEKKGSETFFSIPYFTDYEHVISQVGSRLRTPKMK